MYLRWRSSQREIMKIYCNVLSQHLKTYWMNSTINNLWGYYTRQLNGTPLPSRECIRIPHWSICVISPRNLATSCGNSEIRHVPSLTLSNFLMKLLHEVGTSVARRRSPQSTQHTMPLQDHRLRHLASWENWTCWPRSFIFWVTMYRLYNTLGVLIPSQLKLYDVRLFLCKKSKCWCLSWIGRAGSSPGEAAVWEN